MPIVTGDIELVWSMFKTWIIEVASRSCDQSARACHGGSPRICTLTLVVWESIKLKKKAFWEMLMKGSVERYPTTEVVAKMWNLEHGRRSWKTFVRLQICYEKLFGVSEVTDKTIHQLFELFDLFNLAQLCKGSGEDAILGYSPMFCEFGGLWSCASIGATGSLHWVFVWAQLVSEILVLIQKQWIRLKPPLLQSNHNQ